MNALQSRFNTVVEGALARRLQSAAFARAAQACSRSLQVAFPAIAEAGAAGNSSLAADPACAQLADELLDGETGDGLALLVEDFVREVQPLLGTWLPDK
jgi:hypothetical protein